MRAAAIVLLALVAQAQEKPVPLEGKEREAFLDRLERRMKTVKSFVAEFDQEKKLAVFKDIVKSSGVLIFQRPDSIRWEIRKPFRSILVVSGRDVGKFEFVGGERRALKLGRGKAALLIAMERIRAWFKGEFDRKGKTYDSKVYAEPVPQIVLQPRDKALRKNLQAIRFELSDDLAAIRKVTIVERGGDHTTMVFRKRAQDVEVPASVFDTETPADFDLEKLVGGDG